MRKSTVMGVLGERTAFLHICRGRVVVAVAVTLALLAGPVGPSADAQPAAAPVAVERAAGANRVATAAAVSEQHWDSAADVVLADAGNFPDALAAGALAASLDAPLLTTGRDTLDPLVAEEVERLGATTVHVMGGPGAISEAVVDALRGLDLDVERVAGPDRYATGAAAALAAGAAASGDVVVALGGATDPSRAWPDALSAGAFAATADRPPLLLVSPDGVPESSAAALNDLAGEEGIVHVLGGTGAIPVEVTDALADGGRRVQRLAGRSRYETSIEAAAAVLRRFDATPRPLVVASGGNYPDGLAATALAARVDGVLMLVPSGTLDDAPALAPWLRVNGHRFNRVLVVGGTAAVSDTTAQAVASVVVGAAVDLPAPMPLPAGADAAVAEALAESIVARVDEGPAGTEPDDDRAISALLTALGHSGFTVRDSLGGTVVAPTGDVDQGVALDAAEVAAWAIGADVQQDDTSLTTLVDEVQAVSAELAGADLAQLLLDDLRLHAGDPSSPQHFLALFLTELGRAAPLPHELLLDAPEEIRLSVLQAGLWLTRFGVDLAGWVEEQGGVPEDAAFQQSGSALPCTLTSTESKVIDYSAIGLTYLHGKVLDYLAAADVTGAEKLTKVLTVANLLLQVGQLVGTFALLDIDVRFGEGDPAGPLVRTVTTSAGEDRTLVFRVRMDTGRWQIVNCLRLALNTTGLDVSVTGDGPVSGASLDLLGRGSGPGGANESIQGQPGETFLDRVTDAHGEAVFRIQGRPQTQNLGPNRVPVEVTEPMLQRIQLKPADLLGDLQDAGLSAVGGPVGIAAGLVAGLIQRTRWFGSRIVSVPVQDWTEICVAGNTFQQSCDGGLTGTVSVTYRDVHHGQRTGENLYRFEMDLQGLRANGDGYVNDDGNSTYSVQVSGSTYFNNGDCGTDQELSGGAPTQPFPHSLSIFHDPTYPERLGLQTELPWTLNIAEYDSCDGYEHQSEFEASDRPVCDPDGTGAPGDESWFLRVASDSVSEHDGYRVRQLDFSCNEVMERTSDSTRYITVTGTATEVLPAS